MLVLKMWMCFSVLSYLGTCVTLSPILIQVQNKSNVFLLLAKLDFAGMTQKDALL